MVSALVYRWTDRLLSSSAVRIVLWIVIARAVWTGLWTDPFNLAEWMDEHQFYSWETSDSHTMLHWFELPQWNPYWCGGTVGLSAPEDGSLSPDFLLRLIFGVSIGRRLAILLLVVMGMEGMYRLCRRLDASAFGAIFAAVVYATTDKFVGFIHDGWVNFLGFELIPWAVLCLYRGQTSRPWRLLGGFFVAWIVLAAGTYPAPFTVLTLLLLTIVLSLRGLSTGEPRAWLRPWATFATIGGVAFGLACGKVVPLFIFLRSFPRVFTPVEANNAMNLVAVADKYTLVFLLAFFAVALADRAAAAFFLGAILSLALAMGDFGEYSPFHLLKELPLFGQLRIPDRYMVLVVFFTSVCAARAITRIEDFLPMLVQRFWDLLQWLRKRAPSKMPTPVRWIAIAIGASLVLKVGYAKLVGITDTVHILPAGMYTVEPPREYDQPFKQSRGNRRDAHIFAAANLGSIYCVAGNPVPESALLRGDLQQEEYPEDPSKATVQRVSWSPNSIELDVLAKEPTTILVNQNYSSKWHTDVGAIRDNELLLAVDVPAGKNRVHLRYADRLLKACIAISLLTFIGLLVLLWRGVRDFVRAERSKWKTMPLLPQNQEKE